MRWICEARRCVVVDSAQVTGIIYCTFYDICSARIFLLFYALSSHMLYAGSFNIYGIFSSLNRDWLNVTPRSAGLVRAYPNHQDVDATKLLTTNRHVRMPPSSARNIRGSEV